MSEEAGDQLDLFKHVARAYAGAADGCLDNTDLYQIVRQQAELPHEDLEVKVPIGNTGQMHNIVSRKIRWHQQSLKRLGLLERVDGERGVWRLTREAKTELRQALPEVALVAYSTEFGISIWGSFERVIPRLDIPIALCVCSPPFPIRKRRAYGGPTAKEYAGFIVRSLEPVVANMLPGASIVINFTNDAFVEGIPARSTYLERTIIAIEDELGLHLMDRVPWENPSKAPGPVEYASKRRIHLNVGWEPLYWFTNDPMRVRSNNRRVLQPHSQRHADFIAKGGERRTTCYADGAYVVKEGSYSNPTAGKIPRNVMVLGHGCADHREYRRDAARLGLPAHGAPLPKRIYDFWIEFLTEPGELCVDIFGGRATLGLSAEERGRLWIVMEHMYEYVRGGADRFGRRFPESFHLNPVFDGLMALRQQEIDARACA